jgi:hypothetical protein
MRSWIFIAGDRTKRLSLAVARLRRTEGAAVMNLNAGDILAECPECHGQGSAQSLKDWTPCASCSWVLAAMFRLSSAMDHEVTLSGLTPDQERLLTSYLYCAPDDQRVVQQLCDRLGRVRRKQMVSDSPATGERR